MGAWLDRLAKFVVLKQEEHHVHGGVVYQQHRKGADDTEGVPLPMSKTAMHHFKSLEDYARIYEIELS